MIDSYHHVEFAVWRRQLLAATLCWVMLAGSAVSPDDPRASFFEKQIRPVLIKHCYECHSSAASESKGGLRLDHRDGLTSGGDSGPAIVAVKPQKSLLIEAMEHESFEMPPNKKLQDDVVADFKKWIRDGAFDPRDHAPSAVESSKQTWKAQLAERRQWSPHPRAEKRDAE